MPACAACGNHLSTDYLRVFGDNDGGLESCPHCDASWSEGPRRPMTDGSGTRTVGEADAESRPAPSSEVGEATPTRGGTQAGEVEGTDSEFTVKTAGRSLEWPRDSTGAESSGAEVGPATTGSTDGSHRTDQSPDRFRTALTSVLDAFR